jgi:hypothetical protein
MKKILVVPIALGMLFLTPGMSRAQNALPVVNDTNASMELWIRKDQPLAWRYPPLVVYRGETKQLRIDGPGSYYLVVRDDSRPRRDYALGWYDLQDELRKEPGLKLRMSIVYESRMREAIIWCRRVRRYLIVQEEVRVGVPRIWWEISKKSENEAK